MKKDYNNNCNIAYKKGGLDILEEIQKDISKELCRLGNVENPKDAYKSIKNNRPNRVDLLGEVIGLELCLLKVKYLRFQLL